ncbi:hypothetical protein OEZ85_002389 [Tetradesmus obliquus]|uniref:Uncharacterized protein n=1 Tax=Tetradesmus obliquus TaxID=3088 RepID=A0ABY8U2T6_TETOB|nr:hypothetical protein OEZ85_002389 [Tetradesmus obliquus]
MASAEQQHRQQQQQQQQQQQPQAGKVALVTGATAGIGLATADYLAGQGATVILGAIDYREGREVAAGLMRKHRGSQVEVAPQLDLACQDNVARFAEAVAARPGPLDILVNNAGVGNGYRHTCAAQQRCFTKQGVGMLAQINHLGPYTLTRLLEAKLAASRARVVFVSSIVHRFAAIRDVHAFLTDWQAGRYEHTKLANLYTAFEMQRRLGAQGVTACAVDPGAVRSGIWANNPRFNRRLGKAVIVLGAQGVTACAVDPGAVRSGIWANNPRFNRGPGKAVIDACYAPPEDAARVLLHAATCDWRADVRSGTGLGGQGAGDVAAAAAAAPEQDLRYYARGVFAWPQHVHAATCDWRADVRSGTGLGGQGAGDVAAAAAAAPEQDLRYYARGVFAWPQGAGEEAAAAAAAPEQDLRYYARGVFAWPQGAGGVAAGAAAEPEHDLRYYARGVFAWPQVCNDWAAGGPLRSSAWALNTALHTTLDWPLRRLLHSGHDLHRVVPAAAGSHAYDKQVASELWEQSADLAGLPAQPLVGSQCVAA